jgi:SAM-dependent methyltransferase
VHRTLVGAYLGAETPQGASGFGGSAAEWRDGRSMLLDALDPSRSRIRLLDHACANGHLVVSLAGWAAQLGVTVDPYGVDIAPELIERARDDHPELADRFFVGDALSWQHPEGERFDLVHLLLDVVTDDLHGLLLRHQLQHVVAPGGRLVVSQYGAVSPSRSPEAVLRRTGLEVAGLTRPPMRNGRPRGLPSAWVERE